MNPWLDRLKNQKSLDNHPTKPTKLTAEAPKGGSVGFVGSGGGALEKIQSTYERGFVGFVGPVLAYSEKFEIRASHFKALGLPSSDALALAQSCERRDAEGLDMHTCLECANVRPQQQYLRCITWGAAGISKDGIAKDIYSRLQRCPAFKWHHHLGR